ncbi:hypothetical protein K1L80_004747 [Vibrio fluvialis]|nr:hypothetical protein [Vibrio fluvialis]EKO3538088.1 hypothetical protein [Vibrio fluvialis]
MTKNYDDISSTDGCPLCQHDEYFVSQDGEKFICGQCGFKTDHLKSIQMQLSLLQSASSLRCPSTHRKTMH